MAMVRAAVAYPQVDRLGAIERGLLADRRRRRTTRRRWRRPEPAPVEPNRDRMIHRRQIAFLDVVARAGLADAARQIDAEAVDDVACPAAAVALQFQRLLRGENAAGRARFRYGAGNRVLRGTAGSGCELPTKSAAVLGALGMRCRRCGRGLGCSRRTEVRRAAAPRRRSVEGRNSDHGAFDVTVGAEIRGCGAKLGSPSCTLGLKRHHEQSSVADDWRRLMALRDG